jgi:hypothetical protein
MPERIYRGFLGLYVPVELLRRLDAHAPRGQRSAFITRAIVAELDRLEREARTGRTLEQTNAGGA